MRVWRFFGGILFLPLVAFALEIPLFFDAHQSYGVLQIHHEKPFDHNRTSPFSLGYEKVGAYWVMLSIDNSTHETIQRTVVVRDAFLIEHLEIYEVRDDRLIASRNCGRDAPRADRGLYSVTLPPHTQTQLYLRLSGGKTPLLTHISVVDEVTLLRDRTLFVVIATLYMGILLALMLYNFILYLKLRYTEYLYFVLYMAFNWIWLGASSGLYDMLYVDEISRNAIAVVPLAFIFILLFMRRILALAQYLPRLNKIVNYAIVVLVMWYGVWYGVGKEVAGPLMSAMAIVLTIGMLSVGVMAVYRGIPLAKYFLLATGSYTIILPFGLLLFFGVMPYTFLTRDAMYIGAVIEAVLFSLMLSYRFEELQKATQFFEKLSQTDDLTGVMNRRAFFATLQKYIESSPQLHPNGYILMIDIDFFKSVNDSYGHEVGDSVLVHVARTIADSLGEDAYFARLGGEEFALLFHLSSFEEAKHYAQELQERVQTAFFDEGGEFISVTISIGGAHFQDSSIDAWLGRADKALYRAKEQGRNCVVWDEA